jgi:hypothetical protein
MRIAPKFLRRVKKTALDKHLASRPMRRADEILF